jgi:hypothetical protein
VSSIIALKRRWEPAIRTPVDRIKSVGCKRSTASLSAPRRADPIRAEVGLRAARARSASRRRHPLGGDSVRHESRSVLCELRRSSSSCSSQCARSSVATGPGQAADRELCDPAPGSRGIDVASDSAAVPRVEPRLSLICGDPVAGRGSLQDRRTERQGREY